MQLLFVHQNFPAQFRWLAPALAQAGHRVIALTLRDLHTAVWNGVHIARYGARRNSTPGIHPWAVDLESKLIRGEAALHAARALKARGVQPQVIVAHPSWGESLFLREVWPQAKLGLYCEYHYGADAQFDPEFQPPDPDSGARTTVKNLCNLLQFQQFDAGLSPTHWQADTYPPDIRRRITVVHDGIDTAGLAPSLTPTRPLALAKGVVLGVDDEVITYVARSLEPYRGFHVLMRALPAMLARRPRARVVILGAEGQSYGAAPPDGRSWMRRFSEQARAAMPEADWSRVHFLGRVPYDTHIALLQRSDVHVYLTYPFVLSWSLLEAMSIGCAVVASDTAPVREVIAHDDTGLLVDFFDPAALADAVCGLLDDAALRARLGQRARAQTIARYDLRSVCLPAQLRWVDALAG